MKTNVGHTEQIIRAIAGPALLALGLTVLGATKGRLAGILALVGGAIVTETAITRTCPLYSALGISTT